MPSIRFNCEPSRSEEGVRFRVSSSAGIIELRAERRPSQVCAITLSVPQAQIVVDLLRREINAVPPNPFPDRRS